MAYDFSVRHEQHPTFLAPNGIPIDPEPYVTEWGLVLPGPASATNELNDFKIYVADASAEEIKQRPLPRLKQLGRISINGTTGCWELPIYKDGLDVHPTTNNWHKAGQPRARYGSLMVKGANNKPTDHLAHRTMYRILRGQIPDGYHIDHLCRNARCCYHRHLEAVTVGENLSRIHEARRQAEENRAQDEML